MKRQASLKAKEGDAIKTRSFANAVKYGNDINRSVGIREDHNVDESFKSEIWKEMEMRFNSIKK